jgi:hypothetical protein
MRPACGRLPMTGSTLPMSGPEADAEIAAHWSLRMWMTVLGFTAWTGTPLWLDLSVLGLVIASHWKVPSLITIRRVAPFYVWSWITVTTAQFLATNFLYPGDSYTLAAFVIVPYGFFILFVLQWNLPRQLVAAKLAAEQGAISPAAQAQAKQGSDDPSPAPVRDPE